MKATIAIIAALCAMPMFGQDAETYPPTVPLMLRATGQSTGKVSCG